MFFDFRSSLRAALLFFGPIRRALRARNPLPLGNDTFLMECRRIVHIGANDGGERFLYESVGVDVIWVEPLPSVFKKLARNIRGFKGQEARQALLAETSGREVNFKVANNSGASSSMFDIADHARIWPDIHFIDELKLTTMSLDDLLADCPLIDAIVIDTQGAELLVLEGARRILETTRFVKAEAADFPAYRDGCTLAELDAYMRGAGFEELCRNEFASAEGVGHYYDVIWSRPI